jgi:hypothetical protein
MQISVSVARAVPCIQVEQISGMLTCWSEKRNHVYLTLGQPVADAPVDLTGLEMLVTLHPYKICRRQ